MFVFYFCFCWFSVSLIVIILLVLINLCDFVGWVGVLIFGLFIFFGGVIVDNGLGVLLVFVVVVWLCFGLFFWYVLGLGGSGW